MEPREKLRIYDKGVDRPPEYGSYGESLAIREGDIFIPKIPNIEPLAAELGHFVRVARDGEAPRADVTDGVRDADRSEEHTSELQSLAYLVCRLLLEKKKESAVHVIL